MELRDSTPRLPDRPKVPRNVRFDKTVNNENEVGFNRVKVEIPKISIETLITSEILKLARTLETYEGDLKSLQEKGAKDETIYGNESAEQLKARLKAKESSLQQQIGQFKEEMEILSDGYGALTKSETPSPKFLKYLGVMEERVAMIMKNGASSEKELARAKGISAVIGEIWNKVRDSRK